MLCSLELRRVFEYSIVLSTLFPRGALVHDARALQVVRVVVMHVQRTRFSCSDLHFQGGDSHFDQIPLTLTHPLCRQINDPLGFDRNLLTFISEH